MAHLNIDERRAYVKSILTTDILHPKTIKEAAIKFNCSYSAVYADIAMIKSKGAYTLYPGRNIKDAVLLRDNYTCQYCGKTDCDIYVDHVIPTILGGVGYHYNLVAACGSCNTLKGKRRKVWIPANIDILKHLNPQWFQKILTFVNK